MFEVRVSSHHWEYKEKNQSQPQKPRVGSKKGLALKLRDMKKSCQRLLLLSLSIVSSIQQGGAREPGAQPGQAGASAKHGGVGVGRTMQRMVGICVTGDAWVQMPDAPRKPESSDPC